MSFESLSKVTPNDLDAHEIALGLWQGGRPPVGERLSDLGFKMVVLCAEEWQRPDLYRGVEVVLAPNDDDYARMPSKSELDIAICAAKKVVQSVLRGEGVLVTCWQGWNRSGLVTGLALHWLTGKDGLWCIAAIQQARPSTLQNPGFRKVLAKLTAREPVTL